MISRLLLCLIWFGNGIRAAYSLLLTWLTEKQALSGSSISILFIKKKKKKRNASSGREGKAFFVLKSLPVLLPWGFIRVYPVCIPIKDRFIERRVLCKSVHWSQHAPICTSSSCVGAAAEVGVWTPEWMCINYTTNSKSAVSTSSFAAFEPSFALSDKGMRPWIFWALA